MPAAVTSTSVIASHCTTTHDGDSLAHEVADLAAERAGVGEEQRRLPPVDDDARHLVGAVVSIDAVPAVEAVDLAEHRAVRPPAAPEEQEHGEDDRDDDPFEHAHEDHAERGDHREHHRRAPHPPVTAQRAEVQQRQCRGDHHRGERRLGEIGEQVVEEQQEHHHDRRARRHR